MIEDVFEVVPKKPVDQETADVLSSMLNHQFEMVLRAEIDELLYGGSVNASSGQAKLLMMRRRPDAGE